MRYLRQTLLAGLAAALMACSDQNTNPVALEDVGAPTAAVSANADGQAIDDSYIVVLKEGADPRTVAAAAGVSPWYVYDAVVNGFAGTLSAGQLNALQRNPNVEYVEKDQVMRASTDQTNATWGLDRINQRYLPLDGKYSYTYTGSTVRAYIIDTGIDAGHAEFEGRAQRVYDAFGGNGDDCNGHGTHVAGIVGGKIYGVAKKVMLRGVKVLGCDGSGSTSGIIAAIDWVRKNHIKPAVANMSLGGGYSSTLNTAVKNLSDAGVFVAVAAGNEDQDACNVSPASTAVAFTTAASDKSDYRATFSNYGSCVDAYAPGVNITAAWIGSGTTEIKTISGTSMASPHIAGVSALIKHRYGDVSSSSVTSYIKKALTADVIKNNKGTTPNRLLYKYVTAW